MKIKIFKNLKLGLAGMVLAGSLNGCNSEDNHLEELKKYEPITKENDTLGLFNELSPELSKDLENIYLINKEDFPNCWITGHAHDYDNSICLFKEHFKSNYIDKKLLFHEAAHIKHNILDKNKSGFSNKWKKIANFKYGKHNFKEIWFSQDTQKKIFWYVLWKDGTDGSKDGLLKPYSAKETIEDVAVFVESLGYNKNPEEIKELYQNYTIDSLALTEEISKYESERESYLFRKNSLLSKTLLSEGDSLQLRLYSTQIDVCSSIVKFSSSRLEYESSLNKLNLANYLNYYPLYFADTTDLRYKQKLDLLKEYNFLSNEEHKTLSERLGSLNYLREKYLGKYCNQKKTN